MPDPLRLGIVGYGYTGRQHERAAAALEGIEIAAVAESDPARRAAAALPAYPDYRALLAHPGLDAVSVCLPHAAHEEACLAALAAGKHVLVEKPLAITAAAGERICAAARRAGRTLMVEMTHHFLPPMVDAHRLMREGAIGEILAVEDVIVEGFGALGSLPQWMVRRDQAGGGFGLTSGVHLLDHVSWLAAQPLALDSARFASTQSLGDVEDTAAFSLHLPSGAPVHILVCLRAGDTGLRACCEIYGREGTLRVDPWGGWRLEARGTASEKTFFDPAATVPERALAGMTGALREFAAAVREGRPADPAPEHSLAAQRLVEEAYARAR